MHPNKVRWPVEERLIVRLEIRNGNCPITRRHLTPLSQICILN